MLEYEIKATVKPGEKARARANQSEIKFDASAGRDNELPNPAELLLTSLAACLLKNVERYSQLLQYPYQSAKISVKGFRTDRPPSMQRIEYLLEIDTSIEYRKLQNWHKNIVKFGTITNTLAKSCKLLGKIDYLIN